MAGRPRSEFDGICGKQAPGLKTQVLAEGANCRPHPSQPKLVDGAGAEGMRLGSTDVVPVVSVVRPTAVSRTAGIAVEPGRAFGRRGEKHDRVLASDLSIQAHLGVVGSEAERESAVPIVQGKGRSGKTQAPRSRGEVYVGRGHVRGKCGGLRGNHRLRNLVVQKRLPGVGVVQLLAIGRVGAEALRSKCRTGSKSPLGAWPAVGKLYCNGWGWISRIPS